MIGLERLEPCKGTDRDGDDGGKKEREGPVELRWLR